MQSPSISLTAVPRAGDGWKIAPALLAAIRNDVAVQCARTEPDFVALATNLRGLYGNASSLAKLVTVQVTELRALLDDNRLTSLVEDSSQELVSALEETEQSLGVLGKIAGEFKRVGKLVKEVEQITVALRASVYCFAIETARTPECREAFESYVEELRRLEERILSLVNAIETQTGMTQVAQGRTMDGLGKNLDQLRLVSIEAEATVSQTSREMQNLLAALFASLTETEVHSKEVARHANEAVFQLQFGDIIRQKSEHIIAALEEIEPAWGKEGADLALEENATVTCQTLTLQVAQMQLIEAEINKARGELSRSFVGIGAETGQLAALVGSLNQGSGEAGKVNPFVRLRADLTQLKILQEQGRGLLRHARETGQAASQAVTYLAGHLAELKAINHKMHLQALNAVIIAHSLGDQGKVFRVLSMEVDTLFRESSRGVTQIMAALESMTAYSNEMSSGPAVNAGAGGDNRLEASLLAVEAAHRNLGQTSHAAADLVRKQDATLLEGRRQLGFLDALSEGTAQQRRQFVEVQEVLRPWKSDRRLTAPIDSSRYTMASERLILEALNGSPESAALDPQASDDFISFEDFSPNVSGEVPVTPALTSSDEDPLGDNIELF